ncbi:MAG: protein-glutamate O-methyltransferase CheR [Candidatus Krumholzibacteriota bacterium]|nr:protein-glutamate O-methyltransferase CheR [Candidatus Krumholzibacteriota bacterium]
MEQKESVLEINELTWYINSRYGIDLSMYRTTCMKRRIMHRIQMVGCDSIDEYFIYLNEHPEEIERLKDIVTIHVTGFFRDEDVFRKLETVLFPELIGRKKENGGVVRIWSAGCSTGDETYSLAILMDYLLSKYSPGMELEVFGTDISEESTKTARAGLYSEEKITRVPAQMKSVAFEPEDGMFRISNRIRRSVKFRVHDLFSPPPFSLLDLIVCRNVLIHFEHDIRGQVISRFHSALSDEGLLILGKSEALESGSGDQFEIVDPRNKIFRKLIVKKDAESSNQTQGGK